MTLKERVRYFIKFLRSLLELNKRLIIGVWQLSRLSRPAVTVFGGGAIALEDPIAQLASEFTKKLAENGFSIITGGGPGIMEAANFGAYAYLQECKRDAKIACKPFISAAIGLLHLNQERINPYVQSQTSIIMDHFFSRKWLLVRYSSAFVIFPGGYGTMDELFEILTLKQRSRMPQYPIVLVNKAYWAPLLSWIEQRALAQGFIAPGDEKIFDVVDTVDEIFNIIAAYHGQVEQKK